MCNVPSCEEEIPRLLLHFFSRIFQTTIVEINWRGEQKYGDLWENNVRQSWSPPEILQSAPGIDEGEIVGQSGKQASICARLESIVLRKLQGEKEIPVLLSYEKNIYHMVLEEEFSQ